MIRRYLIVPAWRVVLAHARERVDYWRNPHCTCRDGSCMVHDA